MGKRELTEETVWRNDAGEIMDERSQRTNNRGETEKQQKKNRTTTEKNKTNITETTTQKKTHNIMHMVN